MIIEVEKTRAFAEGWLDSMRKIIVFGHPEAESRDSVKKIIRELSEEEPCEGGYLALDLTIFIIIMHVRISYRIFH